MSSIQERLQLKRVPLDTWNIREQLSLASAVVRSGDQNWMSVSRALKAIGEPNRPPDWYSQKSCAAQYGVLLENVETPKRKKRSSSGGVETPQESILKKLTQERIVEIQRTLAEMNQQYQKYANDLAEARNPSTSDDRLKELWNNLEAAKRAKERETARRAAWLKEREERRARGERTWRPPNHADNEGGSPVSAPVSSPLLTSLLKSSPVVTTPQHITHPANVVETISPSAGAPTLSMLLEKNSSTTPAHDNKHAAIEHIKNQLFQIENQLKASSTPPPIAPPVDIDDIEIKAEDVYVFRDIDLHMPPVGNLHTQHRVSDRLQLKNIDEITSIVEPKQPEEPPKEVIKEEPIAEQKVVEDPKVVAEETPEETEIPTETPTQPEDDTSELEAVKIAFPEVKFPKAEIKVITSDEQKVKEETKESDLVIPELETSDVDVIDDIKAVEGTSEAQEETQIQTEQQETTTVPEQTQEQVNEESLPEDRVEVQDIPLPEVQEEPVAETTPPEPEQPQSEEEMKPEEEDRTEVEQTEVKEEIAQEQVKVEEEQPQEVPPTAETLESTEVKEEITETEETHTETDDDTPMELVREEDKEGKKRKDYSRKKKPDSRTCSGSESATEASAPESPSGSEADRQHRLWKKSVMLVYSRLCAHKYASLFLRPITDEEAPGYSMVVKRPMDLITIRRNIESGVIRTTAEFQRDILVMLTNALMYNSSEHSVYTMAKDFLEEAQTQLSMLVAAQAHAGLVLAPARRKRKMQDEGKPSPYRARH